MITLYATGHHLNGVGHADGVQLLDGTQGEIPVSELSGTSLVPLITTNLQRCGFTILRATE